MNPDMTANGRRLEEQVIDMMNLLAGIERDLTEIDGNAAIAQLTRGLSERRAALGETVAALQRGQAELETRLNQHVVDLESREAALRTTREQLRTVTRRLVKVQEGERRSLARDLHDTSGQAMTVIGLGLSMLKRDPGCNARMRARIEDLQGMASALAEDLHRLSVNLRPSTLDRYGLVPATEELIASLRRQADIEVELRVEGVEERLPDDVETGLYRIVQEACTNIARYARATRASVDITRFPDKVQLRVQDNGRGFDVAEALDSRRLGLAGIRERADVLCGSFTVESSPGNGATLFVEVPLVGPCVEEMIELVADANTPDALQWPGVIAAPDLALPSAIAELARAKALSDAMVELMSGMSSYSDSKELLSFALAGSAAAVGCDYALISVPGGHRWVVTHAFGLPESMIGQRLLTSAVPLASEIERTGKMVVVNNTRSDEPLSVAARDSGVFSGAGFPLLAAGRFLGAVAFVRNSAPMPFLPSEVAFLECLSSLISLAVENAQFRACDRAARARAERRAGELEEANRELQMRFGDLAEHNVRRSGLRRSLRAAHRH